MPFIITKKKKLILRDLIYVTAKLNRHKKLYQQQCKKLFRTFFILFFFIFLLTIMIKIYCCCLFYTTKALTTFESFKDLTEQIFLTDI